MKYLYFAFHEKNNAICFADPFTLNNIGDSVVSEQCAEFIFACFKASYQYFSTPVDYEDSESSDSGINGIFLFITV